MKHRVKSICIIVQAWYDADVRVRRKADALVEAGYSVDVLALRPDGGQKHYVLNGVNVYTVPLGKQRGSLARYVFEYTWFFLWAFLKTPLLMMRRHYLVIDVNTLPDFLIFAPVVARWMGAKLLLDMHEITPEFYISKYGIAENSWIIRLLKYQERISFNFADKVVTINEPIQNLLAERGLPRSKSTVVMNAADEARFAPTGQVGPDARSSSQPARFVMMYHGTLTRIYGLDIAIEAFALAHQEMPGAELWILGSGPESGPLASLVELRQLSSKVKLPGQVPAADIPRWLSRCTVGILPIRQDVFLDFAFPNKLPECIISGKAVIISRLKAIQYYFSDRALAFFEPNSPKDLASQMIRLYRDPGLQNRLAERAREEYSAMRWELMKDRYLTLIKEMIGPAGARAGQPAASPATRDTSVGKIAREPSGRAIPPVGIMDNQASLESARTVAQKLMAYCQTNDWAGHDPYDALNSRLFQALPFLDSKLPRLALTQALKRSPVDIRGLALVPKTQNPKGLALFLSAILKLSRLEPLDHEGLVPGIVERLVALRSPNTPYWCWGYSFPWQTRTIVVPRGAPNLVCTIFVANALLDAFEERREPHLLEMASSAADYIVNELYWTDGDSLAGLSYPMPSLQTQVHNANLLGAALLCRVSRHTNQRKLVDPALNVARSSVRRQQTDGSWNYGELPTQRWIDNFHTGYNLSGLRAIGRHLDTSEFDSAITRGFEFYQKHFIREDGAPRYFHDRTYPIDAHCVAQSILTLLEFRDVDERNLGRASSVFDWAVRHMWNDEGYFYYRVLPAWTIKTSYMRWTQAWMLLAVATLLEEIEERPRASRLAAASSVQ